MSISLALLEKGEIEASKEGHIEGVFTCKKFIKAFNINSPQELLDWTLANIETDDSVFEKLKDPKQTFQDRKGNNHDKALFLDMCLKALGHRSGRFFMMEFNDWYKPGGKMRTVCYFKDKDQKYGYWIESSWEKEIGIHRPDKVPTIGIESQLYHAWEWGEGYDKLMIEKVKINYVHAGMTEKQYVNKCKPEEETRYGVYRKDPKVDWRDM